MNNLILSLDVSTSSTGWAIFKCSSLVESGVVKPKGKLSFFERGLIMSNELNRIQSKAIKKYDCPFEYAVVEKNSVMGPNQQSMIKIGIVTGMILRRCVADKVVFVNVSTWRKHWKFSYKDRSKKSMKLQSKTKVEQEFNKSVKDDEADAILIGSYYVNKGFEEELESHGYY
ncbi:hypothetical protein SAG0142_01090 [Streptococcus agalactiae MRI Z1-024]|uniref:hypothetical protein n=1 Tax=Streptococcus agalactiae TaxID=1311 RepID=UPI0002BC04C7|nr:hypothetical protein [Streptococcus agalactiae]EPT58642.1 hypothetical protein SAG0058_01850 [Streptococcus agalactiae CCUG 37430]EPV01146.1 hypothetical protein SAG0324_02360 [Streptococcus agalactiae GB00300]EPW23616.1 hypothetical protein SAG0062_03315 [Streptococcus agalactiae CCUG 37739]EPW97657.1 hypothetical protein SAG0140_11005 [Streptococcus agalactiae MRI Z1-022]EQA30165.1 hypothetical protein SAG0142_01090 [Streptococcus agalactiae MRI Z1-024]